MAAMGLSKEAPKAPLFAACVAGILAGYVVLRRWLIGITQRIHVPRFYTLGP